MLLAAAGLTVPGIARAGDYQVYSPNVVQGESEFEARAYNSWGTGPRTGAEKALKFSFAHAFTDWWSTELYATSEQEYGENLKLEEFEWENRFQLTLQGKLIYDHPVDFVDTLSALDHGILPSRVIGARFTADDAASAFAQARTVVGKTWIDLCAWHRAG